MKWTDRVDWGMVTVVALSVLIAVGGMCGMVYVENREPTESIIVEGVVESLEYRGGFNSPGYVALVGGREVAVTKSIYYALPVGECVQVYYRVGIRIKEMHWRSCA